MAEVVSPRIYYRVYGILLAATVLTWVFVGAGVAWMGHILILTMSDYLTRGIVAGW
jgi:hypothetical protein